MKNLLFSFCFLFAACTTIPDHPNIKWQQNDCLPQAIAMVEGLKKYNVQGRVLIMQYNLGQMGHSIAVYRYRGRKYGWDRLNGSVELKVPWVPLLMAYEWHWRTKDNRLVTLAQFLEEPNE